MTTVPDGLPTISRGSHTAFSGEACAMEYVSLIAGEAWSDVPSCTDRLLAIVVQMVNDYLEDEDRARVLVPHIGSVIGTNLIEQLAPTDRLDVFIQVLDSAVGHAVRSQKDNNPHLNNLMSMRSRVDVARVHHDHERFTLAESSLRAGFTYLGWWAKEADQVENLLPAVLTAFFRYRANYLPIAPEPTYVSPEQLIDLNLTGVNA